MITYTLQGLTGRPGKTRAARFFSVTEGLRLFRKINAITTAGDNGAINIWRDKAGAIHAERHRFCVTIESEVFGTVKQVKQWLSTNLPLIQ